MKTPTINRLLKKKAPKKKASKKKTFTGKQLFKHLGIEPTGDGTFRPKKKKTAATKKRVKAVMVAGRHLNPIEHYGDGGVSITGKQELDFFRLVALRGALKLEMLGMKASRGRSAYSIIKAETGWKGSREKILAQLEAEITARKASLKAQDKFTVAGQPARGFYVSKKPGTSVSDLIDGPFNSAQDASDFAWDKYGQKAQTFLITEVQGGRDNNPSPSKHNRPFVRSKREMFDEYDYRIAGHYLSAIINGDYTGLDDREERQLNAFLKTVTPGGHWDVPKDEYGNDQEGHFAEDEVSGKMAQVYDVKYYLPRKHWSRGRRNKNPCGGRHKNPDERYNPYVEAGFKNRREYLASLAEDFGVPLSTVHALASVLGPSEDFDGLVTHLEDESDGYMDNPRRVRPTRASMQSVMRRGRNLL